MAASVDRFRKLEEIFQAVLDAPDETRDLELRQRCGSDESLAKDVQALIRAFEEQDKFPQTVDAPVATGRRFGPYEVERLVGQGGMSAVYLAHRADGQFTQQVALKILSPALAADVFIERFRAERQILAALNHPNITRLLDGGVTDAGELYLVMEYIDGKSVTEYCNDQHLGLRARLRLFRTVCSAVQYAHQNLVIHRDLKPGNILVPADGTPKLLDFGIAKLMTPEGVAARNTSVPMMTPRYASPEQIRRETVSTATDVYSLGLLLYELLAGTHPFGTSSSSLFDLHRSILEQDPAPPSAHATDKHASRALRGDLDNIVLKALERDPLRRYPSAEQLSEDLRRYLDDEPVIARKHSLAYRGGKFLGRNMVSVGVVAVFLLALSGTVLSTREQARVAQMEAARSRLVSTFLTTLIAGPTSLWTNPLRTKGKNTTVADVLDYMASHIETGLGGLPLVEAEMRRTLGTTYALLGDYGKAEHHLREALALQIAATGPDHPEVANITYWLGAFHYLRADPGNAEFYLRRAHGILQRLGAAPDADLRFRITHDLGSVLFSRNHRTEGRRLLKDALELSRREFGPRDVRTGIALSSTGFTDFESGEWDSGETGLRRGIEVLREVQPEAPFELGRSHVVLGQMLRERAKFNEAEEHLEAGLKLYTRGTVSALYNPSARLQLGLVHSAQGRHQQAIRGIQAALADYQKQLPAGHENILEARAALGSALRKAGQPAQAEQILRETLAAMRGSQPPTQRGLYDTACLLGATLLDLRRSRESLPMLEECYQGYLHNYGREHPSTKSGEQWLQAARKASGN